MLLANRRVAFLHLLLAAMQAAWIAPFLALTWNAAPSPWGAYAITLGGLLTWMLVFELLSRAVESPLYDTLALALLFAITLLLARLALYGGGRPWDLSWIGRALVDAANWTSGLPPIIVLVGASLVVWQRASAATSRDLGFFGVGVTFRGGLLLLLLGGALLTGFRGVAPLGLLWLYLAAGLSAVAVSRISEKATAAQSIGRLLPPQRLLQTLGAVAAAVGMSWLLSLVYTGAYIGGFIHLFEPLWKLVRPLFVALMGILERLLGPVLVWLVEVLRRMMSGLEPVLPQIGTAAAGGDTEPNAVERLQAWPLELLRDALVFIMIGAALLGLIVFLLLYLERVRKSGLQGEVEGEEQDRATFGGGILGRALDSLRGAAGLIRRFGVGRELLAAISVQNIYANLCRIARQRGKPRLPSQPPDAYLPVLAQAFPGEEERLGRITAAYMRVHYGDHPAHGDELAMLREDYGVLREGV